MGRKLVTDSAEFRKEKPAQDEADRLNVESPLDDARWEIYAHGNGWSIRAVEIGR